MKKMFSLALALIMAMALTVPAFAASIDITNAVVGEDYDAYKIFDVTANGEFGAADTGYSYTIDSDGEWWSVVIAYIDAEANDKGVYTGNGLTLTPSASDPTVYVVDGASLNAADFAAHLAANVSGKTKDPASVQDATATSITLNVAAPGYYFIDSGLGALCALQTSDAEVDMIEKNATPSLDKYINVAKAENGYTPATETNASIGDTIRYRVIVTDGTGTDSEITVHDVMEAGLTLDAESFVITDAQGVEVAAENYTIVTAPNDGCTFEIVFGAEYVLSLDTAAQIYINYEAELDRDAEIADETNDNTAWLTYSAQKTEDKVVKVYTYEFDLIKTDEAGNKLDGAEFKLYGSQGGTDEIKLVKDGDTYRVADTAQQADEGATITAGKVVIEGLAKGTYWLEETVAPAGYNLLAERVEVDMEDGSLIYADADDDKLFEEGEGGVIVINKTGTVLPSTGGMGTTIFYIVGGVLMVGAAVLLVTKKKLANQE